MSQSLFGSQGSPVGKQEHQKYEMGVYEKELWDGLEILSMNSLFLKKCACVCAYMYCTYVK